MAVNLNHPDRRPQRPWMPELERQSAIIATGAPAVLGEFLDHLDAEGIHLARYSGAGGCDLAPLHESALATIARFVGIDLRKTEREKRAFLTYIRACQSYDDDQRERVARAVAHYNERASREVDE